MHTPNHCLPVCLPSRISLNEYRTIAQAQLLNLPISVLGIITIGVTGWAADKGRISRPLFPLTIMFIILICYGVMVAYPSTAGVYTATLIGNAVTVAFVSGLTYL